MHSPGEIIQSLCQLKRCKTTLESSVTIASRSFSGFHSAILICTITAALELKQARKTGRGPRVSRREGSTDLEGEGLVELKLEGNRPPRGGADGLHLDLFLLHLRRHGLRLATRNLFSRSKMVERGNATGLTAGDLEGVDRPEEKPSYRIGLHKTMALRRIRSPAQIYHMLVNYAATNFNIISIQSI